MKKLFAILLALLVIPSFHAHAWVGGPFSNNSYTPNGDDGIYEAVAIPRANGFNGVGLYRFGIFNRNPGGTAFTNGQAGNTSNVNFGGFVGSNNQHVWYINGATYFGTCFGTVNSSIGTIRCVGNAADASPVALGANQTANTPGVVVAGNNPTDRYANSHFTAQIRKGNYFHAARQFQGGGTLATSLDPVAVGATFETFSFLVFGSRVSFAVSG